MRDYPEPNSENWIEITFRKLPDGSFSVRSTNLRRKRYTNRIIFKGGLKLDEALLPSLVAHVERMTESVTDRSSVHEYPDFELFENGLYLHGASLLANHANEDYQQFLFRLNRVEGHAYTIFAPDLIEEDSSMFSPDKVVALVRKKIIDPVNKLSTVFEGYDKDTTFAIIPAYFSVLRRLMEARLEKLELALRSTSGERLQGPPQRPSPSKPEHHA